MKKTIDKLTDYLYRTTGISLHPVKWSGKTSLPYYLNETYDFYKADIFKTPVLIMEQTSPGEQTPATIRKHFDQVSKTWQGGIIYLSDTVAPYNRKRLIEYKVPFVIPDSQLYLPDLGIDLREHFRQVRQSRVQFSLSTQVLILYSIINRDPGPFTPASMAGKLGYTSMTMSRAFDELEMAGIGKIKTGGRERLLALPADPRELWELALPFLKSPLRRTLYVRPLHKRNVFEKMPLAGLTALAMYSMISGPEYQVRAARNDTRFIMNNGDGYEIIPLPEPGAIELQFWSYSPGFLSTGKTVDVFSLYLTLSGETDERIQKALNEMMAGYKW